MNYRQLQDEAIALRFEEANRSSVQSWLNLRMAAIWDEQDWHFKHVVDASLAVTASDSTPTMPPDFAKSEGLFDADGDRIEKLPPDRFDDLYEGITDTGDPGDYKVVNRQVYLGPIPRSSATFKLSYLRRLSHLNAAGDVTAGPMSVDTDTPLWESEYHYVLVLEAAILGQQLLQDPTWQQLAPQRDEILARMGASLVRGDVAEPLQYG